MYLNLTIQTGIHPTALKNFRMSCRVSNPVLDLPVLRLESCLSRRRRGWEVDPDMEVGDCVAVGVPGLLTLWCTCNMKMIDYHDTNNVEVANGTEFKDCKERLI